MDEWKLGESMFTSDSILDGITFDDLILTVHCNIPKDKITGEVVLKELREIIDARLEDMWFLVEKNMDKIIEYSKNFYRDEGA